MSQVPDELSPTEDLHLPPLIPFPPPEAVSPNRANAALVVVAERREIETTTESSDGNSYWPEGIPYDAVNVPVADNRSEFVDPVEFGDYFDD